MAANSWTPQVFEPTLFQYAGMSLPHLALWIALTLAAGALSRVVIYGPKARQGGLFGDFIIGTVGAFVVGYLFLVVGKVDISGFLYREWDLDWGSAISVDLFIVAVIGAFAVRLVTRFFLAAVDRPDKKKDEPKKK